MTRAIFVHEGPQYAVCAMDDGRVVVELVTGHLTLNTQQLMVLIDTLTAAAFAADEVAFVAQLHAPKQ